MKSVLSSINFLFVYILFVTSLVSGIDVSYTDHNSDQNVEQLTVHGLKKSFVESAPKIKKSLKLVLSFFVSKENRAFKSEALSFEFNLLAGHGENLSNHSARAPPKSLT